MIRAVVSDGVIRPLDPLPPDWRDGREVEVREAGGEPQLTDEELAEWARTMDELTSQLDPDDARHFIDTLDELRAEQKELMRRREPQIP